jgi:hypothetical protein
VLSGPATARLEAKDLVTSTKKARA